MKLTKLLILTSLFLTVIFSACRQNIGFGETIDFEAATVYVTAISLPNGYSRAIEKDESKLVLGPGILAGPNCILEGSARDNVGVAEIVVREMGPDREVVKEWKNASISNKDSEGNQSWSISLDGISKGERNITISAYDKPHNEGLDMVKHLTLLVDTETPFVESVSIERQSGVLVNLLPRATLNELNPEQFEHVDYFQNEFFRIKAGISHDFRLSSVTLNFLNEDGTPVFSMAREREGGTSLMTPSWLISADDLIAANPAYAEGQHYLRAVISATAEAGHTGYNDEDGDGLITNLQYNLCWYPDSDKPRIQPALPADNLVKKDNILPLTIFDDDNLNAVYAAMIPKERWNTFTDGTDEEKLLGLRDEANRAVFADLNLQTNLLETVMRNVTIPISAGSTWGEYRLIILTQDNKGGGGDTGNMDA